MTNDLNDTLTNHCILRWRQTMGIILLVVLLYVVPTECTDNTEAYGLKLFNPQNGLRFAMQESTEMNACWSVFKQRRYKYRALRRHRRQPCLTSASLHKQSILCFLSYDAQRLYAL